MIIDTHIHIYDPTRPQGVPFPEPDDEIYRRVMPEDYRAWVADEGVDGAIIVEASTWVEDNQWVLDVIEGDPFIKGLVGNLDPRAEDETDGHGRGERHQGIHPEGRVEPPGHIDPEGQEGAVGEVHHPEDAVDETQPVRHVGVHGADEYAGGEHRQQFGHGGAGDGAGKSGAGATDGGAGRRRFPIRRRAGSLGRAQDRRRFRGLRGVDDPGGAVGLVLDDHAAVADLVPVLGREVEASAG